MTSLIPITVTTELCNAIPSDAYPIILRPDKSFKVYSQHRPIFTNSAQLQDFSDYIQLMPQ